MPPETRALLPHLAVLAAVLDGAAVLALGLRSYHGVVAFAVLFALTVPGLYVLGLRTRRRRADAPAPDKGALGHRQR